MEAFEESICGAKVANNLKRVAVGYRLIGLTTTFLLA